MKSITLLVLVIPYCICIYGPFDSNIAQGVKLTWSIDDAKTEVNFTFTAPTIGWLGFGFATAGGMIYSDVYVASLEDDEFLIRDYYITAKSAGCDGVCRDTTQGGEDNVLNQQIARGDSSTTISFTRKIDTFDSKDVLITEGTMSLIWAYSAFDDEALQYHSDTSRGMVDLNLISGEWKQDTSADNRRKFLLAHGLIMFLVWDVSTAISAIIARYWHSKRHGIKIHLYMQQSINFKVVSDVSVVLVSSLPSFIIAMYAVQVHYRSPHSILGTTFLAIGSVQGALGSFIVFRFPFWEWMNKFIKLKKPLQFPRFMKRIGRFIHPHLGKLFFLYSFVTVYTGLHEYGAGNTVYILFWCWVSTLIFSIVTGEISKFIRKKKNKLQMATSPSSESVKGAVTEIEKNPPSPRAKIQINYTISYEIPLPGIVSGKGHDEKPRHEEKSKHLFAKVQPANDGTRVEDT